MGAEGEPRRKVALSRLLLCAGLVAAAAGCSPKPLGGGSTGGSPSEQSNADFAVLVAMKDDFLSATGLQTDGKPAFESRNAKCEEPTRADSEVPRYAQISVALVLPTDRDENQVLQGLLPELEHLDKEHLDGDGSAVRDRSDKGRVSIERGGFQLAVSHVGGGPLMSLNLSGPCRQP